MTGNNETEETCNPLVNTAQEFDDRLHEIVKDLIASLDDLRADDIQKKIPESEFQNYIDMPSDLHLYVHAMSLRAWEMSGKMAKFSENLYRHHGMKIEISGYVMDDYQMNEILKQLDDKGNMIMNNPMFDLSITVGLVDDFDPAEDEEYAFDVPIRFNKFLAIAD